MLQHLAAHANGRSPLAVIDDAHGLPPEAITELGELTREGPLRVLLIGRPALRTMLQQQLPLQPASLSCHLEPLAQAEMPAYIDHHLRSAGWSGTPEFSAEARALIERFSRGVPRRIDRLCDRLLRAVRRRGEPSVTADAVRRITRPRLDDSTVPMLTSAVDDFPPSGWAASTNLPLDSELPHWARTEVPADVSANAGMAVPRQRLGLALSATVVAAALAFWAYRSITTTTLPPAEQPASVQAAPPAETAPLPAPQPPLPSPSPSTAPTPSAALAEPPRPPAPRPRAAAPATPPARAATPAAAPSPVPGPCTATVAALGLCTPTGNPP